MDEKTLNALVNAIKNKDPKGLKAYENLQKIASSKPKNEEEQKNIEAAKGYVAEIKKRLTTKAAHGAKLDYVKSLKHICPEGEELVYFKQGGSVKCGCAGKKLEEGAKVEKAEGGAVAKFKQGPGKLRKQPQQKTINPSDTVHVKGITYSLTNMNGSRVDNRFPAYNGKVEKEDRAKAQAGDKDAKKRQEKAEMVTAPKKGTKLTTVEKFKSAKCGSKMKKHQQGGSLNRVPFYQEGTPKGGITLYLPKRPISGAEAYMNDAAINDPDYKKYNNKANAYSNEAPTISNTFNNVLNRLKASYYGSKAALKGYYDEADRYSRDQWSRGNYGEAIFGSPFVPIVRSYKANKPFMSFIDNK